MDNQQFAPWDWKSTETTPTSNTVNPPEEPAIKWEWDTQPQQSTPPPPPSSPNTGQISITFLGKNQKLSLGEELFLLDANSNLLLEEIQSLNLTQTNIEGLYEFPTNATSPLGNLIKSLHSNFVKKGFRISNCYLAKVNSSSNINNLNLDQCDSKFIYNINSKSSSLILDFSIIGGPSNSSPLNSPNLLKLLNGWVPYKLSSTSNEDQFCLIGELVKTNG